LRFFTKIVAMLFHVSLLIQKYLDNIHSSDVFMFTVTITSGLLVAKNFFRLRWKERAKRATYVFNKQFQTVDKGTV
jgi:hypothetical protein